MSRPVLTAALLALLAGPGCVHSKQVTNPHVRDLEARHVVVGRTTVAEVLERFGPPPPQDPMEMLQPARAHTLGHESVVYRYVTRERRCVSFLLTGFSDTVPIMPMLPFAWCDDQATHALVVEFDPRGIVERVSRGRTEARWRPWQGTADRAVHVETTAEPGVSLR